MAEARGRRRGKVFMGKVSVWEMNAFQRWQLVILYKEESVTNTVKQPPHGKTVNVTLYVFYHN